MGRAELRKGEAPAPSGTSGGKKHSVAATDVAQSVGQATEPISAEVAVTTTSRPKKKTVNPTAKRPNNASAANTVPKVPVTPAPKGQTPASSDPKPGEKPQRPECLACGKGRHDLDYCREFRQKTYEDKRTYVLTNGHCFNCTAKGHLASDCPEDNKCTKCKGRHNTVLHEDRERQAVSNEQ